MFGLAYSGGWLLKKAQRLKPNAERQTFTRINYFLKELFFALSLKPYACALASNA
jgi:hypothetical protein